MNTAAQADQLTKETVSILFTDKERVELEKRMEILSMLHKGKTQRVVADKLKVGIATVTRGAKEYRKHQELIDQWFED
jgi:Trp operon repressor